LAPKRRAITAEYELGYFAIILLITYDWYDKKCRMRRTGHVDGMVK